MQRNVERKIGRLRTRAESGAASWAVDWLSYATDAI
jgi:hypothetical protein